MQGDRSAAIEDGYGLQQRTHLLGPAGSHLTSAMAIITATASEARAFMTFKPRI